MEYSSKSTLKVGIFIVVGLFVILSSLFMIGADKSFIGGTYKIFAQFDDVQGLNVGSVVSAAGIVIGNVDDITYDSAFSKVKVSLKIQKKFRYLTRATSTADLRTQGALGDRYIYITPGDPSGTELSSGSTITTEKNTDLIGMLSARAGETEKIFDIIGELHTMVKSINSNGEISKIIKNTEQATGHLNLVSKSAQDWFKDGGSLKSSVEKLDHILTKIDSGTGTLGALINDPSLHNSLKSMLGGSDRKGHVKNLLRTSIEKNEGKSK